MQNHIGEKILNFPDQISDKKQLQRFLGCLNYIEGFLPNTAFLRNPLQKKLKKDYLWNWTPQDSQLIKEIKTYCYNLPKLKIPSETDSFILQRMY